MDNNIIGPRVRMARQIQEPHLTQSSLAERLQLKGWNISRSGVAKIELGLRQVTDIEVVRLAGALNVPVSWFFEES
jgi:transcriptional regulator with XRE-family HTH domain